MCISHNTASSKGVAGRISGNWIQADTEDLYEKLASLGLPAEFLKKSTASNIPGRYLQIADDLSSMQLKSSSQLVALEWALDGAEVHFVAQVTAGRSIFRCTRLNARRLSFEIDTAGGRGTLTGDLQLQQDGQMMRLVMGRKGSDAATTLEFRRAEYFPMSSGTRVHPMATLPSCKRRKPKVAIRKPLETLAEYLVY
eukprot:TRINITY_DN41080_c0_g1_i1.p2 TRINITY_DN41080_c0_g1~~TRINITY_DN41080_c0_g1_i1.p2  ORF type:complete len:197 (+),score=44.80 TRINITY_DN41080_c0_g1_i1:63-653(+)